MAGSLQAGGWLGLAVHEGTGARHLDEWFGQPVDLDFAFHERDAVLTAVGAAGLEDVEWYLRGPTGPETTDAPLRARCRRAST